VTPLGSEDPRVAFSSPSVQAGYMKNFAAAVDRLGASGTRVQQADPELFQAIEDASRLSWMPVEWNVRMVHALHRALGAERTHAFLSQMIHSQLDTPMWRGFVQGAVRLLGLDPGSLAKWLPHAYGIMFRHCGQWSAHRDDVDEARFEVRDLPESLAQDRLWLGSIRSGLYALYQLCGTQGEAELAEVDEESGRVRFRLTWKVE
jgi:hypothetical protein